MPWRLWKETSFSLRQKGEAVLKFVDIKTGGLCNNHCIHCVVSDRFKIGNRTASSYKKSVSEAVRYGATHISVTGGEPTLHAGIVDILAHAKKKGLVVTLQTNGRRLADSRFVKDLDGLVDQYVIALHGSTAQIHDAITRRRGSFAETMEGIKNCSACGADVVAKVVMGSYNCGDLVNLGGLIFDLAINAAVFAFPHGVGDAKKNYSTLIVRYTDVWPRLRECIDLLEKNRICASIETFPFCIAIGYEHAVLDYILRQGATEVEFIGQKRKDWTGLRVEQKTKFDKCNQCCFNRLCEGVWREYFDKFGSDEFTPRKDATYYEEFIQDLATVLGDDIINDMA